MKTKDRPMIKAPETAKSEAKATKSEGKAGESGMKANKSEEKAEPEPARADNVRPIATASDRLSRLEQFQNLGNRWDFLKGKDRELKNFTISQDGTAAKISLECTGAQVVISNSQIIEKVVNVCQKELDELLAKTEAEVINFHI